MKNESVKKMPIYYKYSKAICKELTDLYFEGKLGTYVPTITFEKYNMNLKLRTKTVDILITVSTKCIKYWITSNIYSHLDNDFKTGEVTYYTFDESSDFDYLIKKEKQDFKLIFKTMLDFDNGQIKGFPYINESNCIKFKKEDE